MGEIFGRILGELGRIGELSEVGFAMGKTGEKKARKSMDMSEFITNFAG